ncbi:MAG TPA: ornithine carbamoyltransferase [Bacillota bacterium]|nr:ornithine carbamoyltransferase [Bacillota bacterium]
MGQAEIKATLKNKDFLTLQDFTKEELMYLVELAISLKDKQKKGIPHRILEGKTLAMIFEKSSTRTRVSFESGMYQLGGHALFLSKDDLQLGRGEPIKDTAKVISSYVDGIMMRTFGHEIIEEVAKHSAVPVVNGLTNEYHPCQVLADLVTIYEQLGTFAGKKLTYVGDGNNMTHSLMIGCAIMGMDCSVGVPEGYEVDEQIFNIAQTKAAESGAKIEQVIDPVLAVKDADIIYTDTWISMGFEEGSEQVEKVFAPYQVNESLVKHAKDDYLFFHCLPAYRGKEVTEEIIDGPHSVIYDEAENRLHAQKAILASVMDN